MYKIYIIYAFLFFPVRVSAFNRPFGKGLSDQWTESLQPRTSPESTSPEKFGKGIFNQFISVSKPPPLQQPLTVKNLINGIKHHEFNQIYFNDNKVFTKSVDEQHIYYTNINPYITTKLVDVSLKNRLDPIFVPSSSSNSPDPITFVFQGLFIVFAIQTLRLYFSRFFSGGSGANRQFNKNNSSNTRNLFPFMNKESDMKNELQLNVSLSDWAGSKEVLEECTEIVTYLKNSTNYVNAGALIPKGILMEGPPGTGKTLLAKAIACESNANFIEMAGSEFIEMFVGLGAQRVRNLFSEARSMAPCIIFIDEIDAIGRQRNNNNNMNSGGSEEKDQTLNQLLSEMDGFNNNKGIMILAATNRRDILDKALLRPGRFDRIIEIPLPDTKSREEILKLYLKDKEVESNIDTKSLAKYTSGFSGAELKNIINEAAIFVARRNQTMIYKTDIDAALEKTLIGIKKTVDDRSLDVKRRVAIHEVGHAFVVSQFPQYFDLQKVSIQASYSGVGGFTLFTEKEEISEGGLYTKDMLIKRLMVALGGKAAESIFYGEDFVSVGATMDLNQANNLASDMIEKYGMGQQLNVFFKNQQAEPFSKYSESTKSMIDEEVSNLVKEAYTKTLDLIGQHQAVFEILVDDLLENVQVDHTKYLDAGECAKCGM
jgi:cell division protease FtsH